MPPAHPTVRSWLIYPLYISDIVHAVWLESLLASVLRKQICFPKRQREELVRSSSCVLCYPFSLPIALTPSQNVTMPCLMFSKIVPSFNSDNISALGAHSSPLISRLVPYLVSRPPLPRCISVRCNWHSARRHRPSPLLGPAPLPLRHSRCGWLGKLRRHP